MALDRLTKITGPGIATDHNWVGNNATFTGVTTTGSSFNVGVTTIHSTLIEAHNIKSTGIITATGAHFSGNVSIAGTLTYEDITNIDSVGIITAPAVDIDDFLDVGSNIKLGNAGIITASSFIGDGSGLIGVASTDNIVTGTAATFNTYPVDINAGMTVAGVTTMSGALIAEGNYIEIKGTMPYLALTDTNSNPDYSLFNLNGVFSIYDGTNSANRLTISSSGNVSIPLDLDVDGHTELDNINISGVSTHVGLSQFQNTINLTHASAGQNYIYFNEDLQFAKNGTGTRLKIDSNGKLLAGHTADIGNIRTQYNQNNQFIGANSAGIKIASYAANAYASNLEFIKSRSATLGTNTLIQNGDTLGNIFWAAADGANYQPAAYISAVIDGAPNTNDVPTRLSFGTAKDGASGAGEKMRINPAGQVMIGDTTVGNSTTEKLILQGQVGNDNFESSIALRRGTTISTSNAGLGYIKFQDSAGSTGASMGGRADSSWSGSSRPTHLLFYTTPSGSNSPSERMRVHSDGSITKPNHPSFSAHKGGGAIQIADNASADIVFADEKFDNGSNYNTSNGRFTAPVAGKYFFGIQLYLGFSVTAIRVMHSVFKKNGSVSQQCDLCGGTNSDGGTHYHPTAVGSCMINLAANDYVTFNIGTHGFSGSGNTYLYAQSRFFGYLIG